MRPGSLRVAWLALAVASALTSCGDGAGRRSLSPPSTAVADGWLAAIAIADDPNDLEALTGQLLEVGGPAFVTSPASCFDGIPRDVTGYVLGFLASERDDVERLVERSARPALFVVEVSSRCTD